MKVCRVDCRKETMKQEIFVSSVQMEKQQNCKGAIKNLVSLVCNIYVV